MLEISAVTETRLNFKSTWNIDPTTRYKTFNVIDWVMLDRNWPWKKKKKIMIGFLYIHPITSLAEFNTLLEGQLEYLNDLRWYEYRFLK